MEWIILFLIALAFCASPVWGPWLVGSGREDWDPYDEMDQR